MNKPLKRAIDKLEHGAGDDFLSDSELRAAITFYTRLVRDLFDAGKHYRIAAVFANDKLGSMVCWREARQRKYFPGLQGKPIRPAGARDSEHPQSIDRKSHDFEKVCIECGYKLGEVPKVECSSLVSNNGKHDYIRVCQECGYVSGETPRQNCPMNLDARHRG